MKLSIIVPVYNMAADKKLEYCLDSLVAQTVADYEIIAVDDCSTDESWEILKGYEDWIYRQRRLDYARYVRASDRTGGKHRS